MATSILTIGTYTYDNIKTSLRLEWTETIENARHKLVWSVKTIQTPTGSGYTRSLRSGNLKIGGQSYSFNAASIYNGYTVKSGTTYVDEESVSVSMTANVGGETKSGKTTVQLTPIAKALVKEGTYVSATPSVKDGTYKSVDQYHKVNGHWEAL